MEIVSFVILHYGDLEITNRCVQSVLQLQQQERIRIVIVDNNIQETEEKRTEIIKKYQFWEHIFVIQIKEDGGFSHGNNQGYRFSKERLKASFIVILNNDIEFSQKDFLRRLDCAYREHNCHVLAPDVIRVSTGEHQNPMDQNVRTKEEAEQTIRKNRWALRYYFWLYPLLYWNNRWTEKRQTREKMKNTEYYQCAQRNIVPFGACLIFTPKFVMEEANAFEPETRFYYEEYILAVRCRNKGYGIEYDPGIQVLHESGTATKKSFGSERYRMRFMMERIAEACEVYLQMLE